MYFLVNASPPKPLYVATSNFADALVRSKADICDGVPSTGLVYFNIVQTSWYAKRWRGFAKHHFGWSMSFSEPHGIF